MEDSNKLSFKEQRIREITLAYYSILEVKKAIFKFAENRECIPRYFEGFGKRPDTFQYESDITEQVRKGATSFHCSEELWKDPQYRALYPNGHFKKMAETLWQNPLTKVLHREKAKRQPGNLAKAKVHAWLASQVDPDKRLGEAAQAGYWPWDSCVFESLKDFMRNL